MAEYNNWTIAEARDKLRAKEITSEELTLACISAIDNADALGAFVHKTPDEAIDQAKSADLRLQQGNAPALCGIPIGVKDLFACKGVLTQAASKILEGFKPEYESTVTQNLKNAGAITLGKLNMDEFAMGSSNETSVYGNAINPWKVSDKVLTPGGSSGGSASAVAADLCLAAIGTDTGGSIRQPAAFTGIVGIKPTYGRCSRWGIVAFASSLDQAGPMCKSVRDTAIMLEPMCGFDNKDSTSSESQVPNFEAMLTGDIKGKKIGIPGKFTTSYMLFQIFAGIELDVEFMHFEKIMGSIDKEEVDAGVLLHEGQILFEKDGFNKILDLGEEWFNKTNLPIPLGVDLVNRKFEKKIISILLLGEEKKKARDMLGLIWIMKKVLKY